MGLYQHFDDSGRCSEVPIDLEGRMGIEEVWIGASAPTVRGVICRDRPELQFDQFIGMVAIAETCPEVYFPGQAPARSVVPSEQQ